MAATPQLAPLAIVLPSRPASANEAPGKESGAGTYCAGRSAGTLPENSGIRTRTRQGNDERHGHPDRSQPQHLERPLPQAGGKQVTKHTRQGQKGVV